MEMVKSKNNKDNDVLILIIMEDTHGASLIMFHQWKFPLVLILIIMEDTHGGIALP